VSTYLEDLTRKRLEAAARMKEIVETAEARSGDERGLTAEERANLDKFDADYDRIYAEEKRLVDLESKITPAMDELRSAIERNAHQADRGREARFDFNAFVGTSGDKEQRTFYSGITVPRGVFASDPRIREMQQREMEARALQSAGGSAIETSFYNAVSVYERTLNPVMDVATVLSTSTGAPIVFPRLTADPGLGSGTVTAEAAGITEGDATISSVTLNAWKRAYTSLWSAELDQDEIIGLDQLIARTIGRQIGLAWGTAFTTGNDSSEANGYLNAIGTTTQLGTANGTSGNQATDTFFAASDCVDAFYALAAPYRQNASWLVANTALAKMRKFRDSTGQFLWGPALQAGQPESFLNRPVYENPAMAAVASAAISVSVGDFSLYMIRDVVPVRIDRSIEYKFNTDQIALRVVTRRDGDLPDTTGIRAFRCANT
jgi:HK97 family phage major capsid protein